MSENDPSVVDKLREVTDFYTKYNYPDGTDKRKRYWQGHFAKHVELSSLKGLKILDVGCGQGTISQMLHEQGAEVHGIDMSSTSVAYVNEHYPHVNARVGNALELPFEDASFDMVVSIGVLHHTPNPYKGFTECIRVLKPAGRFIPLLYSKWHPYPLAYKFARYFIGGNTPESANKYVIRAITKFTAWYYGEEGREDADAIQLIADQFYTPIARFHSVRTIKKWGRANGLTFHSKSTTFYGEHIMYGFTKDA